MPNFTIENGKANVNYGALQAEQPDGALFAMLRWGGGLGAAGAVVGGFCGAYAAASEIQTARLAHRAVAAGVDISSYAKCGAQFVGIPLLVGGIIYGYVHNGNYTYAYDKANRLDIRGAAAAGNNEGVKAWLWYSGNGAAVETDGQKRTPTHFAAVSDNTDVIQTLVSAKPVAEVEDGTKSKTTGYQSGYMMGNTWVQGRNTTQETVNTKKVNAVDFQDMQGNTPALIAAKCSALKALKKLMLLGSNATTKDNKGKSLNDLGNQDKTVQDVLNSVN